MKVSELIEMLQDMDPEADVHFEYNYGDHWRTHVAPKVSRVDEAIVEYSQYHNMDKIVDLDDEDSYDETGNYKEGVRQVVVIG